VDPGVPGIFSPDLEKLTGRPREHLEFTIWYLVQKKYITRGDSSLLVITAGRRRVSGEALPGGAAAEEAEREARRITNVRRARL
jgi:hypothetical protein